MAENKDKDIVMKCRHMEKVYPGTKALDDVDFNIYRGKVNVLIGENGAGKSTLMKQIAGIEQPSSGKMYLDGEEVSFKNTTEARAKGVGIIHQELSLFPNLNVYQNIFMNNEQKKGVVVNNEIHKQKTKEVLERLEYPIDPEAKVGDLRVGQQQMIEIARNLIQDDLKILIMDEPTSSLSQSEVQVLFKIMRELNAQGISIVYISHRLEEIMEIGDHVTILRDGKYVDDAAVKDIDVPWIVQKMTGSNKSYPKKERDIDWEKQDTVLEVKDLCLPKKGGGWLLDHVSFILQSGQRPAHLGAGNGGRGRGSHHRRSHAHAPAGRAAYGIRRPRRAGLLQSRKLPVAPEGENEPPRRHGQRHHRQGRGRNARIGIRPQADHQRHSPQ